MIVISLFAPLFICILFYQIDAQPPTPPTPPTTTTTTHSPLKPTFINGSVLPINYLDFKFQLSLEFQDNFHFCSAALALEPIPRWNPGVAQIQVGITTAQCFQHNIYPIYAVAGVTDLRLRINNATYGFQRTLVSRVVKHEKFNSSDISRQYDIAIIFFETPFNITRWVSPIKYDPTDLFFRPQQTIVVSGWGPMFPPGQVNENKLQILHTETEDTGICFDRTKWRPGFSNSTMGCYYSPRFMGSGNCHGDAGAPVVYLYPPKYYFYYLIGVVSHGHDCYYDDYPAVYTKVTAFSEWLANKTLEHIAANATG